MFKKEKLERLRTMVHDQAVKLCVLAEENEKLKKEVEENKKLKVENVQLHDIIEAIKADITAKPSDCKIGDACRVCEFGKIYEINHGYFNEYITVCHKHHACPSFIAKENVKESN